MQKAEIVFIYSGKLMAESEQPDSLFVLVAHQLHGKSEHKA